MRIKEDSLFEKVLMWAGTAGAWFEVEIPSCTAYQLSGCHGNLSARCSTQLRGHWGWLLPRCDADGLEGIRHQLPRSYMSCLSAPGGQLGPGRVALHSGLRNNALRWFRSQKPHSADQQRRVPGAHAALRCVLGRLRGGVGAARAHAFCFCFSVWKGVSCFSSLFPPGRCFLEELACEAAFPTLPPVRISEQAFYAAGRLGGAPFTRSVNLGAPPWPCLDSVSPLKIESLGEVFLVSSGPRRHTDRPD